MTVVILSSTLVFAQDTATQPAEEKRYSYQLTATHSQRLKFGESNILFELPTTLSYQNTFKGRALSLHLNEYTFRSKRDGVEDFFMKMNKDLYLIRSNGKSQEKRYKDANEHTRGLLKSRFRDSYARLTLDKEGKELTRKVNDDGKGLFMLRNIIHNARWFHVRFSKEKTWKATRVFDLGRGGTITGPMTLTKQDKKDAAGNTIVKVSGVMTKAEAKTTQGTMKNIKYVVNGTQSYNEKLGIWIAGQSAIKTSYELVLPKASVKMTGTMKLTLTMPKAK